MKIALFLFAALTLSTAMIQDGSKLIGTWEVVNPTDMYGKPCPSNYHLSFTFNKNGTAIWNQSSWGANQYAYEVYKDTIYLFNESIPQWKIDIHVQSIKGDTLILDYDTCPQKDSIIRRSRGTTFVRVK